METKPDQVVVLGAPPQRPMAVRLIRAVVWTVAIVAAVFGGFNGFMGLQFAESAPQQAAGAAMSLFYVITPYVFARAVSEIMD